jgi:hypothetical protein
MTENSQDSFSTVAMTTVYHPQDWVDRAMVAAPQSILALRGKAA